MTFKRVMFGVLGSIFGNTKKEEFNKGTVYRISQNLYVRNILLKIRIKIEKAGFVFQDTVGQMYNNVFTLNIVKFLILLITKVLKIIRILI